MCCPTERVAAIEAIGDFPEYASIKKCGRINLNGTNYQTSKLVLAEIDDYLQMAKETPNNIDLENEHFEDELFDLMGETGNFANLGKKELMTRAKELKTYAQSTNFYGGLVKHGQFNFVARLEYAKYSE
jgi:hypothetical protein